MAASMNLSEYFGNKQYSDITLRLSGEDLHAHKLVLAESSLYFKNMFNGRYAEADATVVELKEDDCAGIFGLIAYCYGLDYDGALGYLEDRKVVPKNEAEAMSYVCYQVNLYVTAEKYQVQKLCELVVGDFGQILGQLVREHNTFSDGLAEVVRHIYITHQVAASQLREPVVALLTNNIGEWKTVPAVKELMLEIPELGYEITVALADCLGLASKGNVGGGDGPTPKKRARKTRASFAASRNTS